MTAENIERLSSLGTEEVRIALATIRMRLRAAQRVVEDEELSCRQQLIAEAGGDPKALGGNKEIREDQYRAAYSQRTAWLKARNAVIEATDEIELAEAILAHRLDVATEKRMLADERRTDAINRWLDVAERERVKVTSTVSAGALA